MVLAAGEGARLRPLTRWRPKPLCPVATVPLLDLALGRLRAVAPALAVNLHHGAAAIAVHLDGPTGQGVHRSLEQPEALGTAGALGALRPWIDGRAVVVTNADAWLGPGIDEAVRHLVAGWDGERHRLLCVRDPARGDFGPLRYCGVALVPAAAAARLAAAPTGLYEVAWREAAALGALDLVEADVAFIDCGTPSDYLAANLAATGGASAVDPHATVGAGARLEGCVVWDGATVAPGEQLVRAIRAPGATVLVR